MITLKKTLNFSFYFFYFLCVIGCDKKPDAQPDSECWTRPTELPAIDGIAYNLGFMKNDTVWVATETTDGIVDLALSGGAVDIGYQIYPDFDILTVFGKLVIEDDCDNLLTEKLHLHISNPIDNANISTTTRFIDEETNNRFNVVNNSSSNKLILNKFDIGIRRAEGVFELDLVNDRNNQDTLRIRQGRFEGNF